MRGPEPQILVGKYTEERGGMLSKLPQPPRIKHRNLFNIPPVCVTANHYREKREPGAKPVYTLGLQNGGNRFRLDVVESSCERPWPCESTLKGFNAHLVGLRSVWNLCVLIFNSLRISLRNIKCSTLTQRSMSYLTTADQLIKQKPAHKQTAKDRTGTSNVIQNTD